MIPLVAAFICTAQLLGEVAVDIRQVGLIDQFTQSGARTTESTAIGLAIRAQHKESYLDVRGAWFVGRTTGSEKSLIIGARESWSAWSQFEYQERGFENCAFSYSDACISTKRRTRFILLGPDIGIPILKSVPLRMRVSGGLYVDEQWSVIHSSTTMKMEKLSRDKLPLMSVQLFIRPVTIGTRTRINGSMRYAHLFGRRSPWVPGNELSGVVSVDMRAMTVGQHQLLVGGMLRIRPSRVPLTTDTAFSLRGTWIFK